MNKVNYTDCGRMASTYWCKICDGYWCEFMRDDHEGISQGDLAYETHYQEYKASYESKNQGFKSGG